MEEQIELVGWAYLVKLNEAEERIRKSFEGDTVALDFIDKAKAGVFAPNAIKLEEQQVINKKLENHVNELQTQLFELDENFLLPDELLE